MSRESQRPSKRSQRVLWGASLAVVLALVAAGIVAPGDGANAMGRGHWRHGGHDPEQMKEHLTDGVDFMLQRLDATDEQRTQATEIARSAFDALAPVVEEHRQHRERMVALFGAETIDREALEALRAQEMALLESASQSLLGSLADLAETLTPEQRAELLEHADHHGHRGWR
jgi:Spy/CpxP family protein refolding chaperone